MKKNKMINLLLIIIIAIILIGIFITHKDRPLYSGKRGILVEKSYINYAWGRVYKGMAICEDGTIYEWDMGNEYFDELLYLNRFSIQDSSDKILKYAVKKQRKVRKSDLEILKKSIDSLKDKYSSENVGNDMGSNAILVWDYTNNKIIPIKESGDFRGENKTIQAKKIIRIVNKYLK